MALILGIDRFLSMCRAVVNMIGNAVATVVVARWENELDRVASSSIYRNKRNSRCHSACLKFGARAGDLRAGSSICRSDVDEKGGCLGV